MKIPAFMGAQMKDLENSWLFKECMKELDCEIKRGWLLEGEYFVINPKRIVENAIKRASIFRRLRWRMDFLLQNLIRN